METMYYTLTARGIEAEEELEQAVGAARRVMLVRRSKAAPGPCGNNVVDLAAWRAAKEAEQDWEESEEEFSAGPEREETPLRRPEPAYREARRAGRERMAVIAGELLSTLAVLAVAAALLVRILVF